VCAGLVFHVVYGRQTVSAKEQSISNKVFTPANVISALRFVMLPIFMVLLIGFENNIAAFWVMTVAALTDMIDGQLARFTNTVTRLGTQLDPIVDRFFILFAVISVYVVKRLPVWVLVVLISRDAVMLIITLYERKHYRREFKVIFVGKVTTAFLMAAFCSLVLMWPVIPGFGLIEAAWLPGLGAASAPLGYAFLYIGIVLSLSSATYYLLRGLKPPETEAAGSGEISQAGDTR